MEYTADTEACRENDGQPDPVKEEKKRPPFALPTDMEFMVEEIEAVPPNCG